MGNVKQLVIQAMMMVLGFVLLALVLMYIMKGMFNGLTESILTRPYPHVYEKPVSARSATVYNGGSIDDFTKKLDTLADNIDSAGSR